jgi:hypothetical protein
VGLNPAGGARFSLEWIEFLSADAFFCQEPGGSTLAELWRKAKQIVAPILREFSFFYPATNS